MVSLLANMCRIAMTSQAYGSDITNMTCNRGLFLPITKAQLAFHVELYGDDSLIFSTVKDRQRREAVARSPNEDMVEFQTWADNWNVTFDVAKCKNLTVSRMKEAEIGHITHTYL